MANNAQSAGRIRAAMTAWNFARCDRWWEEGSVESVMPGSSRTSQVRSPEIRLPRVDADSPLKPPGESQVARLLERIGKVRQPARGQPRHSVDGGNGVQ
jgi:hypothetical protein